MKNRKIILLRIILLLFILINLTGCKSAKELEELKIVTGIGLDKNELNDILLTVQIIKPEIESNSSSGKISSSNQFSNITADGKSVFDAFRNLTFITGRRMYSPHNKVLVLGNYIATEGLYEHLDFFFRGQQIRPTAFIMISKTSALEILNTQTNLEQIPSDNLSTLSKGYKFTSQFEKVDLQDFSSRLISKTTSPIAPIVDIKKDRGTSQLYISGMGVFKNGKMIGELNHHESRGLLWVKGKIKSGSVNIPIPDRQGTASFEIKSEKTKVKPVINDGNIHIEVDIKAKFVIRDQSVKTNLVTISNFAAMEKSLNEYIKQEIMAALKKSQQLNADIFGFGDMTHKRHKNYWKHIEDQWDVIYPSITLKLNIKSQITESGLIVEPMTPEKRE